MSSADSTLPFSRRTFLRVGAAAPLAGLAATARARVHAQALPPPAFTPSINIEIMFPRTMPRADRIKAVAAQGVKVYSFWRASDEEQKAMLAAQQEAGMKCSCG